MRLDLSFIYFLLWQLKSVSSQGTLILNRKARWGGEYVLPRVH